jgi:hypothetical protein
MGEMDKVQQYSRAAELQPKFQGGKCTR